MAANSKYGRSLSPENDYYKCKHPVSLLQINSSTRYIAKEIVGQ